MCDEILMYSHCVRQSEDWLLFDYLPFLCGVASGFYHLTLTPVVLG